MEAQVKGPLAVILRISRVVGIAPLTFIKNQNGWCISLSRAWNIYGYFFISFVYILFMASLLDGFMNGTLEQTVATSNAQNILHYVGRFVVNITCYVAVLRAKKQMSSIMFCLNQIQKVNVMSMEVINKDLNATLKKCDKRSFLLLVLWLPLTILIPLAEAVQRIGICDGIQVHSICQMSNLILSNFIFCIVTIYLLEIQFMIVILHVLNTFKIINEDMKNMINGSFPSPAPTYHKTVRRLSLAFVSTCAIVRELNTTSGPTMLLILIKNTMSVIVAPYFIVKTFFLNDPSQWSAQFKVSAVMTSISYLRIFINFMLINESCHMTHVEMETTRGLVSRLMHSSYSIFEPLAVELEMFRRHLALNQVKYSPLRMVTMTRSLTLAVSANMTTYLVVLLQL